MPESACTVHGVSGASAARQEKVEQKVELIVIDAHLDLARRVDVLLPRSQ